MIRRILTLVIKELLAVWGDPKSRFILLGPPLIEMLIFSFAATQEVKNVPVAVLNDDTGTAARDLIARVEGSPNFPHILHLGGESEVAPALDSRQALMVVRFREEFSRDVEAGRPAVVQLLLDGRRSNAAQLAAGYVEEIIDRYNADLAAVRKSPPPASSVVARVWFNPNLDAVWSTVPGIVAILTTVEGLLLTALAVARERELGTFEQLLVSPLSPGEIVVGKTIPALLIGLVIGSAMILVGVGVFRVPLNGSVPLLYLSMTVYLLAVTGVGLFISSLSKTQQQAILGTFVFMVPAILLSGFSSPVENMPDWLQAATLANPVRHFITIVKGVFLKAAPVADILSSLLPLCAIAAVTLTAATVLFRRRAE